MGGSPGDVREELVKSSFCKLSTTSPTSQLILQPFRRFTYVTAHSPTLPLLHLGHNSFSSPSFASTTSQDFHLHHLASTSSSNASCTLDFTCLKNQSTPTEFEPTNLGSRGEYECTGANKNGFEGVGLCSWRMDNSC